MTDLIIDDIEKKIDLGFNNTVQLSSLSHGLKLLRYNPDLYFREVLGVRYMPFKLQQAIRRIPFKKWTFIKSGHGVGKSFSCAGLVLWFLETYPNSLVYTTAPTARQVTNILWREISNLRKNSIIPIAGKQLSNRLKISESWQAYGFTSTHAVAYQGMHAKYLLWVLDEADGIKPEVWDAIKSTMTGSHNRMIAIGNPVDPDSRFREEQEKRPEDTITIPSFESPNIVRLPDGRYESREVVAGCATLEWINDSAYEWGIDSNVYKSRVLAEYPQGTPDALLTYDQCMLLSKVTPKPAAWAIIGVDVAYHGDDKSVITAISGNAYYKEPRIYSKINGRQLKNRIVDFVNYLKVAEGVTVKAIVYDSAGVATAVREHLEEHYAGKEMLLIPIEFGGRVTKHRAESRENNMDKVENKRAEMYMDFRRATVQKKIFVPSSYELEKIMPKIKYSINKKGNIQIMPKDHFKKENGFSPDVADSVILAYHGVVRGYYLN